MIWGSAVVSDGGKRDRARGTDEATGGHRRQVGVRLASSERQVGDELVAKELEAQETADVKEIGRRDTEQPRERVEDVCLWPCQRRNKE